MEFMKKTALFVVLLGSGSLLAIERAKITYEAARDLVDPVTINVWRGIRGFQLPVVKSLRNPFKRFTLAPGQKISISLPQGPYWIQAIGKDGKKLSGVVGLSPKGGKIKYNIVIEKKSGIFGLGGGIVFNSKSSGLVLKQSGKEVVEGKKTDEQGTPVSIMPIEKKEGLRRREAPVSTAEAPAEVK